MYFICVFKKISHPPKYWQNLAQFQILSDISNVNKRYINTRFQGNTLSKFQFMTRLKKFKNRSELYEWYLKTANYLCRFLLRASSCVQSSIRKLMDVLVDEELKKKLLFLKRQKKEWLVHEKFLPYLVENSHTFLHQIN